MLNNRLGCLRWVILIALGGVFYYVFRFEIGFLKNLILTLIQGSPVSEFPAIKDAYLISLLLSINLLGIVLITVLVFYWTAGTVFPVKNNQQAAQLMGDIVRSWQGHATPILMTKEGLLIGEVGTTLGNQMIVDLESAVVLESTRLRSSITPTTAEGDQIPRPSLARVAGPGLVIKGRGEKLRDVISLRNQIRVLSDVRGQTKDGIELRTNTSAIFSLAGPPGVIQVAYDGDQEPENLRIIQIDPQTRKIQAIINELEDADQVEIHRFAQDFIYYLRPNSTLVIDRKSVDAPPYLIDEQRILAGVYSRARNVGDWQSTNRWVDLPAMIAAETYRNMISRYTLDELYLPDDSDRFPLHQEVKPEFSRRIRSLGVLAFQFIIRQDGVPPDLGERVDHRSFRISEVHEMQNSRVLRRRGINILHAGFSDPVPTDPMVNQQRLISWQARWQREENLIRADQDQELIRIKNQARLSKQREMTSFISAMYKENHLSEETLTKLIFQELENAASFANSYQLISTETFNQLHAMRLWLLPERPDQPNTPVQPYEAQS